MILLGILLSTVGTDLETGAGAPDLRLRASSPTASTSPSSPWACSASPRSCATSRRPRPATSCRPPSAGCCPTWQDLKQSACADRCAARSSARSSGILPGNGAVLGPFASYTLEKKLAKDPARFGRGAIEGVAGPEIGQQCRRADLLHPAADARHPAERRDGADGRRHDHPRHHAGPAGHDQATRSLFWGMIASMWIGNLMLLVINLPLIGAVGALLQGALPADVPGDPDASAASASTRSTTRRSDVIFIGRLRPRRLCAHQVRLRAGAAAARLRARQADGGEPAPGADHLARRRSIDLRSTRPVSGRPARGIARDRRAADHGAAALDPQGPRRGFVE